MYRIIGRIVPESSEPGANNYYYYYYCWSGYAVILSRPPFAYFSPCPGFFLFFGLDSRFRVVRLAPRNSHCSPRRYASAEILRDVYSEPRKYLNTRVDGEQL